LLLVWFDGLARFAFSLIDRFRMPNVPTDNRLENLSSNSGFLDRRALLKTAALMVAGAGTSVSLIAADSKQTAAVRTVLGPVAAKPLGVTLMHEHAPIVEWSELYEAPPDRSEPVREVILTDGFLP
jgi:hypothetical protein